MTDRHDLLFIYGTLMSVAEHPLGTLLRDNARFVGAGSIQARLYSITEVDAHGPNTYPGALPSPDPADRVFGELWQVTNPGPVWPALDRHEACTPDWPEPHEFLLRPVPVTLDDGRVMKAVSYLYAWDVSTAQPIPSGRYDTVSPYVR